MALRHGPTTQKEMYGHLRQVRYLMANCSIAEVLPQWMFYQLPKEFSVCLCVDAVVSVSVSLTWSSCETLLTRKASRRCRRDGRSARFSRSRRRNVIQSSSHSRTVQATVSLRRRTTV